jgi:hypothetical protein
MADFALLTLDLRSPLAYSGLENPPLSGAPLSGRALLPTASGALVELGLGADLAEGEEELFLFDEGELVEFDPDDGPSLRRPLPRPRYYGRRSAPGAAGLTLGGAPSAKLGAGGYAFLQWRPRDEGELMEGLEWFAREAWWERAAARGPYILRRVREHGKLATQALRSLKEGAGLD